MTDSPRTLDSLLGVDSTVAAAHAAVSRLRSNCTPRTVLVVGDPGTGKSHLADAIAGELGRAPTMVYCAGLYRERPDDPAQALDPLFDGATESVILIDSVSEFGDRPAMVHVLIDAIHAHPDIPVLAMGYPGAVAALLAEFPELGQVFPCRIQIDLPADSYLWEIAQRVATAWADETPITEARFLRRLDAARAVVTGSGRTLLDDQGVRSVRRIVEEEARIAAWERYQRRRDM